MARRRFSPGTEEKTVTSFGTLGNISGMFGEAVGRDVNGAFHMAGENPSADRTSIITIFFPVTRSSLLNLAFLEKPRRIPARLA